MKNKNYLIVAKRNNNFWACMVCLTIYSLCGILYFIEALHDQYLYYGVIIISGFLPITKNASSLLDLLTNLLSSKERIEQRKRILHEQANYLRKKDEIAEEFYRNKASRIWEAKGL